MHPRPCRCPRALPHTSLARQGSASRFGTQAQRIAAAGSAQEHARMIPGLALCSVVFLAKVSHMASRHAPSRGSRTRCSSRTRAVQPSRRTARGPRQPPHPQGSKFHPCVDFHAGKQRTRQWDPATIEGTALLQKSSCSRRRGSKHRRRAQQEGPWRSHLAIRPNGLHNKLAAEMLL